MGTEGLRGAGTQDRNGSNGHAFALLGAVNRALRGREPPAA